jgi:N-acyl-D-aspartate/D-glutamate deacylase
MDFDLVFRSATLVDGTGVEPYQGDLGVRDRRIVATGKIPDDVQAGQTIDGTDLVLSPGFIDIHTHSDLSLIHDSAGQSKVQQGVTTEVVGNCGFSAFPVADEHAVFHREHLSSIDQAAFEPPWTDFDGYAARLTDAGTALNVASLVGHGCLRIAAMGLDNRTPDGDDLDKLKRLLDKSMSQGAFGLSTGLTYVPSMYAETAEICELAKVVADHQGIYATHARLTPRLLDSVEEAIAVGRASSARVQYSHVAVNNPKDWGRADEVVAAFHLGREHGVDITFDVYPYDASSSALTQYLPAWVQAGGMEHMTERLQDREVRRRAVEEVTAGWYGGIPWLWNRILVSQCPDAGLVGQTIATTAESEGRTPADLMLHLCERYGGDIKVVLFYRTEQDMLTFLTSSLSCVGSDGNAVPFDLPDQDRPHPRFFGCFPRVLGRYVREKRSLSLAEAVKKMTSAPADRLGITDRGRLADGRVADLVAFRADAVLDQATFADPCRPPVGIEYVMVNGVFVIDKGHQTAALPGHVIRH